MKRSALIALTIGLLVVSDFLVFADTEDSAPLVAISFGSNQKDTYTRAVQNAGGRVWKLDHHISTKEEADSVISVADALIVPGSSKSEAARNKSERLLMESARAHKVTVLGVCHGEQRINVNNGGTIRRISKRWPEAIDSHHERVSSASQHIIIKEGSLLHRIFDTTSLNVNSYHHWAVDSLADGLTIVARADDGIVEAIEGEGVLGVQFHPELFASKGDTTFLKIFKWLVGRAAETKASRVQIPMEHRTVRDHGVEREYYLYVPDSLAPSRPLVVLLHGYGGSAEGYRPEMARAAAKYGFVLCVPQGLRDPSGEPGWNVRYPSQAGMKTDDVAFVMNLCKKLQREYRLRPDRAFLTGMSNGGEMCYLFAWEQPQFFRAIASVAGLTMEWVVRENDLKGHVPFLEIHGTQDKVSMWDGDPCNTGGWGSYLAVPQSVGNIAAMNRCTWCETSELPLYKPENPSRRVILHHFKGGTDGSEVRLYEVVGGKHSWHLEDINTVELIWSFFERYL